MGEAVTSGGWRTVTRLLTRLLGERTVGVSAVEGTLAPPVLDDELLGRLRTASGEPADRERLLADLREVVGRREAAQRLASMGDGPGAGGAAG